MTKSIFHGDFIKRLKFSLKTQEFSSDEQDFQSGFLIFQNESKHLANKFVWVLQNSAVSLQILQYVSHSSSLASPGFFAGGGGERPGHLKAITLPPQGVRGRRPPRTDAKFHFVNRFKVLENPFFSKKNSKNWTYFTRISDFFEKII